MFATPAPQPSLDAAPTTAANAARPRLRRAVGPLGPKCARTGQRTRAASPLEILWRNHRRHPGDQTRNRLVENYQPLLAEMVRRFGARLPRNVDRGDLATAANFGLMAAIENFDPARGVRFEAYCELRVRGALLDELRNQDWLSRPFRARLEQLRRAREELRSRLQREPGDDEIAREVGLSPEEYAQVFGPVARLGMPAYSGTAEDAGEDSLPGLEVFADPHAESSGERLGCADLYQLATQRLSVQEYQIVYLRYWEDLSLREIGQVLHLSESRVCKIHTRLLGRLKERLATSVPG